MPANRPLMVRSRENPIPRTIFDVKHNPPPGHHAVPLSRDWNDVDGAVELLPTPALRVELSHRRGPKPRWSDAVVRKARRDYWLGGNVAVGDIAARLGTTPQSAANLLHGKTYWWV